MAVGVQVPPSAPSNEKAPILGLFYESLITADSELQLLLRLRQQYPTCTSKLVHKPLVFSLAN